MALLNKSDRIENTTEHSKYLNFKSKMPTQKLLVTLIFPNAVHCNVEFKLIASAVKTNRDATDSHAFSNN